jgi:hypothetical protein
MPMDVIHVWYKEKNQKDFSMNTFKTENNVKCI